MNKKRVIVQGCGTAGLAVIRALGKVGGFEVIAMTHTLSEIGCASKYASEIVKMPHPGESEKAYIDFLMENGPKWKGTLILETGDYMAVALSKHKNALSEYYRLVTPSWKVLGCYIEKDALYRMADACGVPHPLSITPESTESLEKIRSELLFPCIIKPVNSHEFVKHFGTKMFHAHSFDELISHYRKAQEAGFKVVVQEVIPGPESNFERLQAYVNSKGVMAARFFNAKVRQHPPNFGVMRIGKSMKRNNDVEELTERILKQGNYKGYCSAEFKRDPRDNKLKLIEINVRMPRSGWLAIKSGVNMPLIIYKDLVEDVQIECNAYNESLYWIECHTDWMNILKNRSKEPFSIRDYVSPYVSSNKTFAVWDHRDIGPFLRQTRNVVNKLKGK